MKKILFLFTLLFVVSSNVQSQKFTQKIEPKIVSDKIDADGFRSIICSRRSACVEKKTNSIGMGLSVLSKGDSICYYINFGIASERKLGVNKNSPLLIKFGDGSVYTGAMEYSDEDAIGTIILYNPIVKLYQITVQSVLADDIIDGLKYGVSKIRVEVNNDIYDVNIKEDNLSQFLLTEYDLLKNALSVKRSFGEGF